MVSELGVTVVLGTAAEEDVKGVESEAKSVVISSARFLILWRRHLRAAISSLQRAYRMEDSVILKVLDFKR